MCPHIRPATVKDAVGDVFQVVYLTIILADLATALKLHLGLHALKAHES
jgi:hypothetical protein